MSSPRLLDQVRDRLRVKHYSMRTEDTYQIRQLFAAQLGVLTHPFREALRIRNLVSEHALRLRGGRRARERKIAYPHSQVRQKGPNVRHRYSPSRCQRPTTGLSGGATELTAMRRRAFRHPLEALVRR